MSPRPTALLVMPESPARRQVASALEQAGLAVRTAQEPYEATLALSDAAPDLVVLDLRIYRRRDRAFLAAVRRRSPATRTLLLLPDGGRRQAIDALKAGADAYVLDPSDPTELGAVAQGLLRRADEALASPALARLAREAAHAVNNALQVLSLWAESTPAPRRGRRPDEEEDPIARIRAVVTLLSAHGRLGPPVRRELDLGRALQAALETAAKRGVLRPQPPPPADGPVLAVDPGQVGEAFALLLDCLAGLAGRAGAEVSVRVARPEAGGPVEVVFETEGLVLAAAELDALASSVLRSNEVTRQVHPGLAHPAAVARLHGGDLAVEPTPDGVRVRLSFPG